MERKDIIAKANGLGLEFPKTAKTTKLVEMIETVTGEKIEITKAGADKKEEKQPETQTMTTSNLQKTGETKFKSSEGDKTIRCIIHSGDKDNDENEMVGSVNGEPFQCQIGIEMDLPVKFLASFEGSTIKRHVHIFDKEGNPTKEKRVKLEKKYIVERL